jgi:acyl carrier protein
MDSIEEMLRSFIAETILFSRDGYPFSDDTSFLENGVMDSMSVMELVMFTEKRFQISIRDEEIIPANFDSIRNLAEFIRRKKNPAPASPGIGPA